MKRTDLESSRPLALPEPVGAGVSLLLHVLLIVGVMTWGTAHKESSTSEASESAQFLYPLLRPMPKPVEERVSYVGLGGPSEKEVAVSDRSEPKRSVPESQPSLAPTPLPAPEPPHAYSEIEVDSTAVRDPASVGPTYPPALLEAHIEGGTLVRFIVDSTGHVDPESILVLESTNVAFTQAVKDVLPKMKYSPAKMGSRAVAQMVEQRFGFRISPSYTERSLDAAMQR
jgi:outer membrane biosynthesis protein TonB